MASHLILTRLMSLMMDLERQGVLDRQELPYRLVALAALGTHRTAILLSSLLY